MRPGWPFVSPYADSIHQHLQKLFEVFQQAMMKNMKLVGFVLFLCIPTCPAGRGAGAYGPGRNSAQVQLGRSISGAGASVGQGPDLTFSTEVALKAMIFIRIQQQTRVLDANHSAVPTSRICGHQTSPSYAAALSKTHS